MTSAGADTIQLGGGIEADDLSFAWDSSGYGELNVTIAGGPAGDSLRLYDQDNSGGRFEKLGFDSMSARTFLVSEGSGDTVEGSTGADILFGLDTAETLSGREGGDNLYGKGGDDRLYGEDGDDILVAGLGNDTMTGGDGNDRYEFRRGDGSDTVTDASGTDTLTLTGGVDAADLTFSWNSGGDLTIALAGGPSGDRLRLTTQDVAASRIEKLDLDDMDARIFAVANEAGGGVGGSSGGDFLFGLTGGETLIGYGGDDILYGKAGDDVLSGGDDDDTLVGGTGNDTQKGGQGDDRYEFNRGDGADGFSDYDYVETTSSSDASAASAVGVSSSGIVNKWVNGYYWSTTSNRLLKVTDAGTDTIVLGAGIKADDLSFSWSGTGNDDLVVTFSGGSSADRMTIYNQNTVGRVDRIALAGMTAKGLVVARTGNTTGTVDADLMFDLSGNDVMSGSNGDDILYGGKGNDALAGNAGNDTYHFETGDGSDTIIESSFYNDNDELAFGSGIDWNELWFAQQGDNLVISVLATTDKVTVSNWFKNGGNLVETIQSGDGSTLHHSDVASLVAAMASFSPSTSASGPGIVPGDSRLGSDAQIGTIAATMKAAWQRS